MSKESGKDRPTQIGWNVSLYMPLLTDKRTFVAGQRAQRGGMWYCEGRLGKFLSPEGKILHSQVEEAEDTFLALQDIYIKLGKDPHIYNANNELQFSFSFNRETSEFDVTSYGYRAKGKDGRGKQYTGNNINEVFSRYLQDLQKIHQELQIA